MRILYDTTWSTRGVLQAVGRKPRGKNLFDFQVDVLSPLCMRALKSQPSRRHLQCESTCVKSIVCQHKCL